MDSGSIISFLILLLLLIFFAGTEIPLMSIAQHTIESAIKKRRFGAKALKKIKEKNESLLIVNLIGTTVVTIAISSLGTVVAIGISKEFGLSQEKGAGIAILVVSSIVLLIGEISPKIFGVRYSEATAFLVAPIYKFLMWILTPIIFLTDLFVKLLNALTGGDGQLHSTKMTSEEFEAFIDISRAKGAMEEEEHRKIKGVLDLGETLAESVMTPRVRMDAVSIEMTVDELCEYFLTHSHSRIPVYEGTIDHIDFLVTIRDAFKFKETGMSSKKLKELTLTPIIKIPLNQPIDRIFELFQKSRRHIALVLDEHGGVEGIITLEDIIEEVFGDIKDETDKEDVYISRGKDGKVYAKGDVLIEDLLEELKIGDIDEIGIDKSFIGENLSYIITSVLERFPEEGEKIGLSGKEFMISITVKQVNDGKIGQLEIENRKI